MVCIQWLGTNHLHVTLDTFSATQPMPWSASLSAFFHPGLNTWGCCCCNTPGYPGFLCGPDSATLRPLQSILATTNSFAAINQMVFTKSLRNNTNLKVSPWPPRPTIPTPFLLFPPSSYFSHIPAFLWHLEYIPIWGFRCEPFPEICKIK